MAKTQRANLEKKGWRFGSPQEFLGLSAEEVAYIELKIVLSDMLKAKRVSQHLTQQQFAQLVNSSQSRVAKMEAGDPTVSIDLLVKSLLALGASKKELERKLAVTA